MNLIGKLKTSFLKILQSIETSHYCKTEGYTGLTALELTGTDRVGLLSEVFAVLADLE